MATDNFARVIAQGARTAVARNGLFGSPALTPNRNTVRRIAIVGDSYVDGSGSAPNTFAVTLSAALRAQYGDAGNGYIPWGNMAGYTGSGWTAASATGPGTSYYRWDVDANQKFYFMGQARHRAGGTGDADSSAFVSYVPNTGDSFTIGNTYTMTHARIYFTIRSALSGFQVRQSDVATTVAPTFGSGASFTGSTSGTTLTASAVSGVIPKTATRIFGGVTTTTVTTGGGTGRGGAGTYSINTSQTVASTAMTADPNIETTLNVPQVADYFFDSTKANNLQILSAYGDIVASGVETFNGSSGVTVSDFGYGGTLAYQFASLDPVAQRRYFELANFDLVIFVLGMNDRSLRNETLYGTDMARLVSWAKACPKTRVMVVRQLDPSDAASTFIKNYDTVLKNVAQSFGCDYYDMRSASSSLATYSAANAAGLMLDGVHPNATGNALIGTDLASKIIL